MSRTAVNALCWIGLVAFTTYLLWVNNSYYRANTRTPTYDEAWYLETSLHLYHRLTDGSLAEFLEAYKGAFGTKAPLISVLPLPFFLLFGTSHYSALLVNSVFIVVSNFCLFLLGRRLFSAEVGLAAVVFYQTMPLAYGLSRTVMAEYGLATLVIAWLYYLVASEQLTRGWANFALGVILGLGLLMKVLFPAFIVGPLLVACILRRRKSAPAASNNEFRLWRACARWPLVAILVPGVAIAATWYAFNVVPLLRFAWHSAYGEIAGEYGAGGLREWLLLFINQGTSFYYAAAIVVFGIMALGVNRKRISLDHRALLLLAWLIPPLVALAAGRNQLIRFVLPLLPIFALVLALSIFSLGRRSAMQAALAVLLAVYPQRLYAALSYFHHGSGQEHPVRMGPFLLFSRDLGWAHPPVWEDEWEHRRVLEALRRLATDVGRPQYVVVGIEHVYLNANLLNYLNAYREYPLRFTSLGYAEDSAARAVERIFALDARFLLFGEGFQHLPEFLNRVNDEIRQRIADGKLPFQWRATVPMSGRMRAVIYEREAPLVRYPPGTKPPQPAHVVNADLADGIRLLGYDWKRTTGSLGDLTYYWKVLSKPPEHYSVNIEFRRGDRLLLTQEYSLIPAWEPGEVVKQTMTVYLPDGGPVEAQVRLIPWGAGPPRSSAVARLLLSE